MNIYFQNIQVINPLQNLDKVLNLWVKDGKIIHLSENPANVDENTEKVDGKNLVCSPGFFDMHVHFREPGYEYKETVATGANSAANGGFTGVLMMPNTDPAIDAPTVVEYLKNKAKDNLVDVHVSAAITKERKGESLTPMLNLADAGVIAFTDDGNAVMNSEVMRRAFDYAASKDLLLIQHCEDHDMTGDFAMNECKLSYKLGLKGYPTIAEDIIVDRDIRLAEYLGNRRYHVAHISSSRAIDLVREAKAKGLRVTCEVTPHHFTLTDDVLIDYDTNHKMNPPLRASDDIDAIINGIIDGTIDCIATDHAPHALHEKDVEYENAPYGIIGLETSIAVSLNFLYHRKHISLSKFIDLMSSNPRRILNLPEIEIQNGENANLSIFDPEEEWVINADEFKTKSRNTPFNGMHMKGKPKYTINNGKVHKCEL